MVLCCHQGDYAGVALMLPLIMGMVLPSWSNFVLLSAKYEYGFVLPSKKMCVCCQIRTRVCAASYRY
jgi:hypothetical protein